MTEEIIIDGVNVAGCVQLIEEPFYPCGLGGECKGWENCYYKQLKRLEQENKELGRKAFLAEQNVQTTAATFCEKDNKIIELEQENKELKSDVLKWQKAFSRQYQINENKGYSKAEENYRSTLEEIRNDLKEVCKEECDYAKPKFCGDCDCRYGQILNKINEVLQ